MKCCVCKKRIGFFETYFGEEETACHSYCKNDRDYLAEKRKMEINQTRDKK